MNASVSVGINLWMYLLSHLFIYLHLSLIFWVTSSPPAPKTWGSFSFPLSISLFLFSNSTAPWLTFLNVFTNSHEPRIYRTWHTRTRTNLLSIVPLIFRSKRKWIISPGVEYTCVSIFSSRSFIVFHLYLDVSATLSLSMVYNERRCSFLYADSQQF